ncbi:MAG: Tn3 family transposase, partial [Planctomycetota bacterium]
YTQRRETVAEHQERIRKYLGLLRFSENVAPLLKAFLFEEACRFEKTSVLLVKAEQFLREQKILRPSDDTLQRLLGNQRNDAREFIFQKIAGLLSLPIKETLDALLDTKEQRFSDLQLLKQPPGRTSPGAILTLIDKIEMIKNTEVLDIDLIWLSNNFQRALSKYTKRCNAKRIRELEPEHRYSALVCFLVQTFKDTVDFIVDMYDKLINKVYNHAQNDIDAHNKNQRKKIRESLYTFRELVKLILDDTVEDSLIRQELFRKIDKETLSTQIDEVNTWLNGRYSHVFNLVKGRFAYIRQFSIALLKHLNLQSEGITNSSLLQAVGILRQLNEQKKRKLPGDVPLDFIPKRIRSLVESNSNVDKQAWECALLTAIRDEIKAGNLSVENSKRFGRFQDFFISVKKWEEMRETFFRRAGFSSNPKEIGFYLKKRLNRAFDLFIDKLPENTYACIEEDSWRLSADSSERLDKEAEVRLERLKDWLGSNMRTIKLPELLIDVDNELKISRFFMSTVQQENPRVDDICAILATIMAHGCNIGPYTMSHLIDGISYRRIRHITDWMMTEETQRTALAAVVDAISQLDITQAWGEGRTSSSDGQRFAMKRKVLQQTYSPKFNDFALEFYSFIADNYAPYYSLPIECTDRDAPYVLDGLLYNESDLPLEEHYVDTHGYTENNFAAFAMLGKRFSPRIRGLYKQRIYCIDTEKDYHALTGLVCRSDRTIHMDWICDQWDRMGHFYASLECGHTTASTAMKRLNGFTGKNHFYRANRELGRIFKTEHILQYMSDKALRQRTRRGLLKGEQLHALARDLNYGKRGRIQSRDLQEQMTSCSCLTLILAGIVYWQAKEINRVVLECDPEGNYIDLKLMEHVSPITWDNVIIYGQYVLNQSLIKV